MLVAVHCSLEAHASGQRVDVETAVREMRKQREGMVQTPDQYRFIYEALVEALDPLPSEEIPRSESESVRRSMTKVPKVARPFSQPPQDQDTPRTKRRKLYLQHTIPPPPSYPPPEEESKGEEERESSHPAVEIASPPPPTSSPPPPLTPSTSTEGTPTKVPFPQTPSEVTPTKPPLMMQPDIIITPPTRHSSVSDLTQPLGPSDQELVQRKLESLKEEKEGIPKEEEEREPERQLTGEAATVTAIGKVVAKRPSKEGGKREPELPSQKRSTMRRRKEETGKEERPPPGKERPTAMKEDPMTEEDFEETFEGFEIPPPEDESEVGFEIGDDQVLKAGPPPKMEKVVEKPKVRPQWQGYTPKPPPQSTGGSKPRKLGQVPFHSTAPPPVNQTEGEAKEVRKVGKLVIPGVFSADAKSPPASPERKPVSPASPERKPVSPVHEEVKPVPGKQAKPDQPEPQPSGHQEEPQRIGKVNLSKWETSAKTSSPATYPWKHLQTTPTKPHPQQPPPPKTDTVEESGGSTPPILRTIRKMEAGGKQGTTVAHPPYQSPASEPAKPVKPVKQEAPRPVKQEVPKPDRPEEQDSPPVSNIAKLRAKFEGRS